jgi:hypothetical protein
MARGGIEPQNRFLSLVSHSPPMRYIVHFVLELSFLLWDCYGNGKCSPRSALPERRLVRPLHFGRRPAVLSLHRQTE